MMILSRRRANALGALAASLLSASASTAGALAPAAAPALGATANVATHGYYVPAAAHSTGAYNSFWKTLLQGGNPAPLGGPMVTFEILAHPRGAPAQPTDPRMNPYSLHPQATFDFPDILGMLPYTGAAWLEIRSDGQLDLETSSTYNASPNGEQQGSSYPIFNTDTLWTDQRFAHRGDTVRFRLLGDENNTRENYIIFVPPESDPVRVTANLYDSNGGLKGSATLDVQPGTYTQASTLGMLYGDPNTANPGDTFTVTTDRLGGGDGDVLAYHIISRIQTLNPAYQDSTTLEGTIERLVEKFEYRVLPVTADENDPATHSVHVITRPGTQINAVGVDFNGDGSIDEGILDGGGTSNTFDWYEQNRVVLGTYSPMMRVFITDDQLRSYPYEIHATPHTGNAERDGYIATYNDAKAFILGNLRLGACCA